MRRLICLLAVLAVIGCGGGGSSNTQPTPQQFTITSGNWDFAGSDQAGSFIVGGNLTQSGTALTGMFHAFNSPCYSFTTDIPFNGTAGATSATMTSATVASQVISATVNGGGTSGSGTFKVTGGCADGSTGTFTATLVPSLSGKWTGSFLSVSGPPAVTTSANLAQTAGADADGLFGLSGTATLGNSVCFTSATIAASWVTGRVVLLLLNNSDGSQTTFAGTVDNPSAAKSMSGTYSISGGSCSGDSGTGTISR